MPRAVSSILCVANGNSGEVHTSMTTRYKQDDHARMMELSDLIVLASVVDERMV